jgi:hypothetical protein
MLHRSYRADEIDAIAAYCADLDQSYLMPHEAIDGITQISLRVAPTKNNQRAGVQLAADYEFGARLTQTRLGPIAQLGER